MMKLWRILFSLLILLPQGQAKAQNQSLLELIELARHQHPALLAAQKKWEAAVAEIPAASALPDPQVGVGLNNVGFDSLSVGSEMMSNASLMASQMIPFPLKLGLKADIKTVKAQQLWMIYRQMEQDILTQLKLNYYDLYYTGKAILVIDDIQKLLKKLLKTAEIKYSVGKASQQDVLRVQVEISKLLEQREKLEQRKQVLMIQINELLGRPQETTLPMPQHLPTLAEFPLSFIELNQKMANDSPTLGQAKLEMEIKRLEKAMAFQEYMPDLMLRGGYMYRGLLTPVWEFKMGVTLPIYAAQKQNNQFRAAELEQVQSEVASESVYQKLQAQLQKYLVMARTEKKLEQLYHQALIPQSRVTFDASLASYIVGGSDFSTVLENLTTLFKYELMAYEKQVSHYQAIAEIEGLIGRDLEKYEGRGTKDE